MRFLCSAQADDGRGDKFTVNLETLSTLNNEPVFDLHDVALVEVAARVKRHFGSRVIANDEASHALKETFSAARQSLRRTLKGTSKIANRD